MAILLKRVLESLSRLSGGKVLDINVTSFRYSLSRLSGGKVRAAQVRLHQTSLSRLSGGKERRRGRARILSVSKPPIRREGGAVAFSTPARFSKPPIRREGMFSQNSFTR